MTCKYTPGDQWFYSGNMNTQSDGAIYGRHNWLKESTGIRYFPGQTVVRDEEGTHHLSHEVSRHLIPKDVDFHSLDHYLHEIEVMK